MKKLVYILSLAIGLLMTGCAQWETMESLPRDTWGPEPELKIEVSPLDSITGELISDKMDVVFYVKNATKFQFVYAEGAEEIDYTDLLKGLYGGASATPNVEGDTLGITIPNLVAGNTYTVYAVVANDAGVQTSASVTVGAIDVTAPVVVSSQLTPANAGKQVSVAFDEAIIRTDAMGDITFEAYDSNFEVYAQGTANATASGKNLVVSLPADFNYNADDISVVLLSFAEGAVEDKFGNKMAALVNVIDDEGLPNGPWWIFDPNAKEEEEDGFFKDGGQYFYYGISKAVSEDGSETEVGTQLLTLTLTEAGVDMSKIFNGITTGDLWSYPSIFNMFTTESGFAPVDVPCYTYTYQDYTYFTRLNAQDEQWLTSCGSHPQIGTCYLGEIDQENKLYPYWDFVLLEDDGEQYLEYAGNWPVIFFFDDNGDPALLIDFESLYIFNDGEAVGAARIYETPVVLKDVKLAQPQAIKKFNFVEKN